MAEADEAGKLTRVYGFNPIAAQQGLWSTDPIWQAEVSNASLTHGDTSYHYLHTDHLGMPQLATTKDGNMSWKATSEAFGAAGIIQGQSTIEMNMRFPGQYFDSETGAHYNFRRNYLSFTGRYAQRDPLGMSGGMNVFNYVKSNPLWGIDPKGLKWTNREFIHHYFYGGGQSVSLSQIGLLDAFVTHSSVNSAMNSVYKQGKQKLIATLNEACDDDCTIQSVTATVSTRQYDQEYDVTTWGVGPNSGLFSIGDGELFNMGNCSGFMNCKTRQGFGDCVIPFYIRDWFKNPLDIFDLFPSEVEVGVPYRINGDWIKEWSFVI